MKIDNAVQPQTPQTEAQAQSTKNREGAKTAAKQLEAFFLRQMLAEARPQGGGFDGGFAGDTFKQMLDEAIADKMAGAGGIGMSQMFTQQLDKTAGTETPGIAGQMPSSMITDLPNPDLPAGAPHFVLPVAGRASSGYGMRADPVHGGMVNHPGFDLAAPTGTEVRAAAAGTVTHAGPAGTYGNLVTVRHENGFETRYAHLSAVDVNVGDKVTPGQDIGKVGTTGYSTGPHLHFEVRQEGQAIDPAPFLSLNRSAFRATR